MRAAPGGTGAAKFAGNYAASLVAQAQAAEQGCDQVVWLDAVERRWIEEMGGMNLFFVFGSGADARVVTPELSGSLLAGITRDSLLSLATGLGYAVEERRISTEEWEKKAESGELTEVFACGTAAVITPVGSVKHAEGSSRSTAARRARCRCGCAARSPPSSAAPRRTRTAGWSRSAEPCQLTVQVAATIVVATSHAAPSTSPVMPPSRRRTCAMNPAVTRAATSTATGPSQT